MANSTVTFPNGYTMPVMGYGTWGVTSEMYGSLGEAFDAGYRLIDTAETYSNEHLIGKELRKLMAEKNLKREDIFVTTKLPPIDMGTRERVRDGFRMSLEALQLDYVDLYLIHWPISLKWTKERLREPLRPDGRVDVVDVDFRETWKAMEELVDEGRIRSLGLSNFNSEQIERVHKIARHPICNLQIECHVYYQAEELREFCKKRGITMTCWAPLGSPNHFASEFPNDQPLRDPVVAEIAKRHSKTCAQVLLRFLTEEGLCVIPRSTTPSRIRENRQIFDFTMSPEEMEKLRSLGKKKLRLGAHKELFGHAAEYPFNIPF